ncbi:unnamed protein product [Dovyalis caffra]|uniref:Peptide-N(4)-(N-acetyl-beta-glucosaminyl)asparagine amidase n=1 Tax=Dovyalis caffra TaxID=77055 RepID=A0AAV1RW57_9ROSI|nr:unnamed protein product [Dovyalis caffra]
MVARQFFVNHNDSTFDVVYDTADGLEVFKYQLFSLTSIPPHHQQIFGEDDDRVVSDDSDLTDISNKLKLIKINEEDEIELLDSSSTVVQDSEESVRNVQILGGDDSDSSDVVHVSNELKESSSAVVHDKDSADDLLKSDEEFARMLQAEEEALMLQEFAVSQQSEEIEQRIRPYIQQVLTYEDPVRQEAARKTVPREELEEKALVSLAKEGNFKPSKIEQDHAFLQQLLFWFKQSFRWVNAPPCDSCGNDTVIQGMGAALPSETQYGAARVELYRSWKLEGVAVENGPIALPFIAVLLAMNLVWWNKKLDYIIAIAKDGVYDVTKRYTRKWLEVLSRRNITREPFLSATLHSMTQECRRSFTSQIVSVLEDRDKSESEELERFLYSTDDSSVSLPGRQSGDKEWRIARSEIGSDEHCSLSCTSCPVRVCVDEHVTKIYNAFSPLLSRCVNHSLSKSRIIEILKMFKGILVELRNSPYKTRRASINPFMLHLLPYFDELLNALSLKSEIDTDGKVDIGLAGYPVNTALALPVVLDALDDLIQGLNNHYNVSRDSLSWPLIKLNRIHSGSVLASGEELPFGIATSAFDGLRMAKWEEPNGAKGCWIVYKLPDNQMHKLVAYELMSANDAPERDPMDWVVEGSHDGGSSWHLLDKQTSQMFENRFHRKSFMIDSNSVPCDTFRFRFLAVKDVQSNSRLQLGSIDLYASSN